MVRRIIILLLTTAVLLTAVGCGRRTASVSDTAEPDLTPESDQMPAEPETLPA